MLAKRYFKNYRMIEIPDSDREGKVVKKLVYFGDYHVCELSEKQQLRQKTVFMFLSVIADVLLIFGLTRNIPENRAGVSAALGLLSLIPLFFLTAGSICNLSLTAKITENEYRESRLYIRYGAVGTAILMLSSVAFDLIHAIHYFQNDLSDYLQVFLSFLVVFGITAYLFKNEFNTPYSLVEGMGVGDNDPSKEQHPYLAEKSLTSEYHEGLRNIIKRN